MYASLAANTWPALTLEVTMKMRVLVFSLLLTMAGAGAAVAQTTVLFPGQQVRLWEQGRPAVQHVARLTQDSLFLRATPAAPHGLALADIQRMDVRVRRTQGQQVAHDMAVGSLVGAVAGAVFGLASGGFRICVPMGVSTDCTTTPASEVAVALGVLGFGGGAVVGGLRGWSREPRFIWRSAGLPLAPPPSPGS
jgi:hypothetical protein